MIDQNRILKVALSTFSALFSYALSTIDVLAQPAAPPPPGAVAPTQPPPPPGLTAGLPTPDPLNSRPGGILMPPGIRPGKSLVQGLGPAAGPGPGPGAAATPLPPPPNATRVSSVVTGVVDQYVLNPRGEADGLYLVNGTQIHFPPHMCLQLLNSVRPGNQISASGISHGKDVFDASAITNISTNKTIVDQGPDIGKPLLPPDMVTGTIKQSKIQSKVKAILNGPMGDVNGFLLTDKTTVRMPPETAFRLASIFEVGQPITVEGRVVETSAGKCIEATALGTANQPLISIYGDNARTTADPVKDKHFEQ